MRFKQKKQPNIYLDYASSTPIHEEVKSVYIDAFSLFENPSSIYIGGEKANNALREARSGIARLAHVRANEVYFTSGATESNNIVIRGLKRKGHIVTSTIEHASVREPIVWLEKNGWQVTWVSPDETGHIHRSDVIAALRDDTVLVSLIYVQNEIGTIQDVSSIARAILKHYDGRERPLIHTDASQGQMLQTIDMTALRVDALTLSSHKVYGPRGVGALVLKVPRVLDPLIMGGGHERGLRAGTPNVAGAIAFARALARVQKNKDHERERLGHLKDHLVQLLSQSISHYHINGTQDTSAHIINISIDGISGEQVVIELDVRGVSLATGSACSNEIDAPATVREVYGALRAESSIRISMGLHTKESDLDYFVKVLIPIVLKLRTQKKFGSVTLST
ncbi:MAG: cysteine desulfurase family protein [bacterium]|nr:cysteine desulfurase family protein [bacterium]